MNVNKDMISIIIPVYNCEQYLMESIYSILSQTYRNIEIILVDDGSTDNTRELCDLLAEKDARVRVFHKKNEGVSVARNFGIENSIGEYLYFCDADDLVFPYAIEAMKKMLEENQSDMCVCRFTRVENSIQNQKHNTITCMSRSEAMNQIYSNSDYGGYVWNKMFRREKISQVRFRNDIAFGEDELFCMQCMEKVNKVVFSSLIMYYYRDNPMGTCNSNNVKKEVDAFIAKNECRKILIKYDGDAKIIKSSTEWLQKNCTKYFYKAFKLNNRRDLQKKLLMVFNECYMYSKLECKDIKRKVAIWGMVFFSKILF